MASGLLTDRAELEELFAELADELARLGATAHVVMVGGSWMLWHDQRTSTRDVGTPPAASTPTSPPPPHASRPVTTSHPPG
jgi:hypothetical protein